MSFTSAPVTISPPPASTMRASASGSDTAPPTGSVKLAIVGEDGGKHDAGAGHVLGRDHVHVGREQRADALVDKMLAHDAEEVVLGVRQQLFCLGTAQPVDELLARHRRVVERATPKAAASPRNRCARASGMSRRPALKSGRATRRSCRDPCRRRCRCRRERPPPAAPAARYRRSRNDEARDHSAAGRAQAP